MSYFFKMLCIAGVASLLVTETQAQDVIENKKRDNKEIIIRKKTDKDAKVTIEINGEDIKVNGKPLSDFEDTNIEVNIENIRPKIAIKRSPASAFRGSSLNFDSPVTITGYGSISNKAVLGVMTGKTDDGLKVNSVTKGSAAEKAGIKEGDIITKIDDAAVATPDELSKAVGKYNPEDKIAVTVKRDKKEQKISAVLAKPAATSVYSQNFDFDYNSADGVKSMYRSGNSLDLVLAAGPPRLGLKAQDTDDSKGVKILGVDKNSAAEKSGIKEGDLITEFDGKTVNGTTELMEAARTAKDKNNMKVKLLRDGKLQDLELKIPKKLKTANL